MPKLVAIAKVLGKSLVVLAIAAVVYVALGYLALGAMYRIYGGSGHPPLPAASDAVYISIFAVSLPLVGLGAGLGALRLWTFFSGRRSARR